MKSLAIDLGATSGRVMLGELEDGVLTLDELHRFANTPVQLPTGLYWDTLRLFHEIRRGLAIAGRERKLKIDAIGVDTWGVDFALLGRGRPELMERVSVVAESPLSPCLPFIASARLPAPTIAAMREALFAALAEPDLAETRAALGLKGARIVGPSHYDRVLEIERSAAAKGYARLP